MNKENGNNNLDITVEDYLKQECEKLIEQLGTMSDEKIEAFLAKSKETRKQLERDLMKQAVSGK